MNEQCSSISSYLFVPLFLPLVVPLGLLLQEGGLQLSSDHVLGGVHLDFLALAMPSTCRKEEKKSNEIKALLSFLPFVASMGGMDLVRLLLKQKKSISKKQKLI
jgi:hypothetical protein